MLEDTLHITNSIGVNSLLYNGTNSVFEIGHTQWIDTNSIYKKGAYFAKFDTSGNQLLFNSWGYDNRSLNLSAIHKNHNSIYISGHQRISPNVASFSQFYLTKLDTNGNMHWEKIYPATPNEFGVNAVIYNNRIFMGGYREIPPYYEEDSQHIIKKTDTNGLLLYNKYLPYKKNQARAFLSLIDDATKPTLVTCNVEHSENGFLTSRWDFNELRIRTLDTNLNVINTNITPKSSPMVIYNSKYIGNGKILIVGSKFSDSSTQSQLVAWATVVDTTGKVYWERKYKVRDLAPHLLSDGIMLDDGSFIFCGAVGGVTSQGTNPDAILIKVDSIGCLDTVNCFPLANQNIEKNKLNVRIYPNPSSDDLWVDFGKPLQEEIQILVYDLQGNCLEKQHAKSQSTKLESHKWADGLYIIQLIGENVRQQFKILKQ